jgi:hypothetical protein
MENNDLASRVREIGISLGSPKMWVPARVELANLHRRTPEGCRLVAVYGGGSLGLSVSPLDEVETWRICRGAINMGLECTVYAVPNSFIRN